MLWLGILWMIEVIIMDRLFLLDSWLYTILNWGSNLFSWWPELISLSILMMMFSSTHLKYSDDDHLSGGVFLTSPKLMMITSLIVFTLGFCLFFIIFTYRWGDRLLQGIHRPWEAQRETGSGDDGTSFLLMMIMIVMMMVCCRSLHCLPQALDFFIIISSLVSLRHSKPN